METINETRVVCMDWDEDVPVATWNSGRGRKPARKVITRGRARVGLTRQQSAEIVKKLASGMEVRLSIGGEDAVRLYPCADTDFKTMFVASEAMGGFRREPYLGRHLAFMTRHGARRIGDDEIAERVARAECGAECGADENEEREHVTPDTVVTCPKCGYEFRVGKKLA